MPQSARESIYEAISSIRLIDPHTHINPHSPASSTLADLLGYHYYTELAHSAGMPKDEIEQEGVSPRELVRRLVTNLGPLDNTAQYRWLIEICRTFFGFDGDRIDESNWESVYEASEDRMRLAEWPQLVLDQSNVEAVFLTNDFDDPLSGFDTETYIPCLRTDDLVFHLAKYQTRQRLESCTGMTLDGSLSQLRACLEQRFEHFVAAGARACAISLPPSFEPRSISEGRAATAWDEVIRKGALADDSHQVALSRKVFWTLAELCDQFGLPFDLMIGVNRGVYAEGVFQGQDLYDSRVSLIQYRELFNSFPNVKFPISVLASVTNQELVSYAWIFPNVITNGHWWYSNTPSFIARDAAARLEAVPRTKQIGYYSDAYKLEFVWPKFDMYRHILAGILADQFVGLSGWSEERAIDFGRQVLRNNVDEIFPSTKRHSSGATSDSEQLGLAAASQRGGQETIDEVGGEYATVVDSQLGESLPDANRVAEESGEAETGSSFSEENSELPDNLTVVDNETVREDLESESIFDQLDDESTEQQDELDPVPNADEIQSVGLDDVELSDTANDAAAAAPDAESIDKEVDDQPLDVGDLMGEESDASESPSQVRMLRGETSFMPDEDTLQLQPDPLTGELKFRGNPGDESAAGDDADDYSLDTLELDPQVFDTAEPEPAEDAGQAPPSDDESDRDR